MTIAKHWADVLSGSQRFYATMAGTAVQVQRRHHVPRVRQLAEILYYKWRLGAGRSEYYMFELYRRDMSDVARRAFLMQAGWNALSCVINLPNRKTDDSKLLLARHLHDAGIPTPATLGYTAADPTPVQRAAPEFIPLEELARIMPSAGCVMKRDRSTWGRGVLVFDSVRNGVFHHVSRTPYDVQRLGAALRQQGGGFLVQERLDNHPTLAALELPSLATLRVLTYGTAGDVRIARAALKLPVGRTGVDNYHAGGIAAAIDLDSGLVGTGVGARGMEWLSSHPETGRRFEGLVIPCWSEVVAHTRRAAATMPEFRCVGWDVALTPGGVRVIEANSVWGTDIVQRPHRAGIWDGDFRRWCLDVLGKERLPASTQRWLGLTGTR